jgi:ketosteroid isomerase-like protein
MSREGLRRLQAGYDALGRGDDRAFVEFLHPHFRYRTRAELPGGGEFVGREVFNRRLAELQEMFEDLHVEPGEFIVRGDYVVVPVRWTGRGRAGGVQVSEDVVHVWRILDARGVELQVFSDRTQALEAVGLREVTGQAAARVEPSLVSRSRRWGKARPHADNPP